MVPPSSLGPITAYAQKFLPVAIGRLKFLGELQALRRPILKLPFTEASLQEDLKGGVILSFRALPFIQVPQQMGGA